MSNNITDIIISEAPVLHNNISRESVLVISIKCIIPYQKYFVVSEYPVVSGRYVGLEEASSHLSVVVGGEQLTHVM